jgi:hypothetical protein
VSLKFPYHKYPNPQASGGYFYAATLPVNIALPAKNSPRSKRFETIIDSGASQCIFHAAIGRAIGLEIEKGELASTNSIEGASSLYLHDIALYLPGGIVPTRAGFSDKLPIAGLLGMTGFFEHFKVTFDPTALRVELERLYSA